MSQSAPDPTPRQTDDARPESGAPLPAAAKQAAWPQRVDVGGRQVAYTVTVDAPAEELWALLANPHRHHEIDGSGTVKQRVTGPHRLTAGDRFRVAMRKYGLPYTMALTCTASDEGRLVEWAHPGGHRWRWEFEPVDATRTQVTEIFDYSWARPVVGTVFERLRLDRENAHGIQASLTRLAARHL